MRSDEELRRKQSGALGSYRRFLHRPFLSPETSRELGVRVGNWGRRKAYWLKVRDFKSFCEETGWRRGLGYGYHPYEDQSKAPQYTTEGALPLEREGFELRRDGSAAATGISWFDAVQYCRWSSQQMLPAEPEGNRAETGCEVPRYSWSADWHSERNAYMTAIEFDDAGVPTRSVGINSDYRSERLGLALIAT